MQLEYICDMELVYRQEPLYAGKFMLVRPYGGEEGTGYGEGDGSVSGPRIQGSLRWVNPPYFFLRANSASTSAHDTSLAASSTST